MEYATHALAKLSGVSSRTLRYYDEIGLLKPARVTSSGYRIYGGHEVDTLQQILFYRELEFPLDEIKALLTASDFDRGRAFAGHLSALEQKRMRLERLIETVTASMAAMKGETDMSDQNKFAGFGQSLVDENERRYGAEIRAKYGEDAVERSNEKVRGMTKEQYDAATRLSAETDEALKAALAEGDPAGALAQEACRLHKQWLCIFYPGYNKEYHRGLGELYVADERFRAYYDRLGDGCAAFLRDAIGHFCAE